MQNTVTPISAVFPCNIRTFAVLCAILAAPIVGTTTQAKADHSPATQLSAKRKLIRSWQNYFRAIRTLEYEWEMKSDSLGEPGAKNTARYMFLWNGKHFRLDTDFYSNKKRKPYDFKSTILTFDGKFYRELRTPLSGERRFGLSDPPANNPMPYNGMPPVLDAFRFIFEEDEDPISFETLRKEDVWRRFEKRIVSIKPGTWQRRRGYWLLVEHPEYRDQMRVFVDSAHNFPLLVVGRSQVQLEGKDDYSDEAYDSQVTRTIKWRSGSVTYVFPQRIVSRAWSKEFIGGSIKRTSGQYVQELTVPVKINQPIKSTRFEFDIPTKTLVYYTPRANSKPGRPYPFVYDPNGGTLWAQEQRQRQRAAQKQQRIAALPKVYDEKAAGKAQIEKALEEAKENNKRILLQFGANWCAPCHTLHDLLTKNPEIAGILQQDFVVVNIDLNGTHNSALEKQYANPGLHGIPFLVVLDAAGKRLAAPSDESLSTLKAGRSAFDPKKILAFLNQWKSETEETK